MKVSVVIPAYNEEKYIGTCLESLLNQEVKPDEIIVVNNNSTDRTVEIASQYPVRVVHEKLQGIIASRNRGFNEAKYEIIARTDADTLVPTDWIKKIKKHFLDKNIIAVSGPTDFYDIPSHLSRKTVFNFHNTTYFQLTKQLLRHDCLFGPNEALRKSVWEKVKNEICLDDTKVHEDIDLSLHIAPYGKIVFDRNLQVSSSFRRFKSIEKIDSYFEYPYRMLKSIQAHKPFSVTRNSKALVRKFAAKIKDL